MVSTTEVLASLAPDELRRINAYWHACNYLAAGMIYLRANPLLREPLKPEHIKNRLLGHWGSDPGQSLIWIPFLTTPPVYAPMEISPRCSPHTPPFCLLPLLPRGSYPSQCYPPARSSGYPALPFGSERLSTENGARRLNGCWGEVRR